MHPASGKAGNNDKKGATTVVDDAGDPAATRVSEISVSRLVRHAPDDEPVDDDAQLGIGTVVRGRFELEAVLGQGGMGVVYRAVDHLHREMEDRNPYVALKVLSARFKRHPDALITLQRETRKAQTLAHENIINVHSFDRDGSIVYMTMELLDGQSLRTIIAENAETGLAPDRVVPMIRGMAKALAYAHENGIVHADFKPGNIFLTTREQIKVLDFGVARAVPTGPQAGAGDDGDARVASGMTPAYASPQMLEGQTPHPSDDVYALALVAYELLTGRHPYDHAPYCDHNARAFGRKSFPGLTRTQSKALARAFRPDRQSRHAHAGEFLQEFDDPARRRVLAPASAAVALAVPLSVYMVTQDAPVEPEIAFAELPAATQQAFDEAVGEGDTALGFGAQGLNDALFFFSRAYDLHPMNPRAVAGLEAVAGGFIDAVGDADGATRRDVFEKLLYCQDYLKSYAPVTDACADAFGPAECAAMAARCAAQTD